MPRFEPFSGLRYDPASVELDTVIAPPYDVIAPEEQARLEAMSPYNAVRVELPRDTGTTDRYEVARCLLEEWTATGILVLDDEPSLYVYRMGFRSEDGAPRHTMGVIGALGIEPPGEGDVLPHEETTPKAKSDRLSLLRQCQANLSPIWGLSLTTGLSELCSVDGAPTGAAVDGDGVEHAFWRISDPASIKTIAAAVEASPIVIADGHHRYETANTYRAEQRSAGDDGPGDHDLVMAFVVELTADELAVHAIHRLISGLPPELDLPKALAPWFEASPTTPPDGAFTQRMVEIGALGLVTPRGTWLLRPRPAVTLAAEHDLDSSRLDVARRDLPAHDVTYQHGVPQVVAAVDSGAAQAAVLLRPATVDQIAATGHERRRMPPKTTFFHPKPRTGLVFRRLH